jgi:NTP pyrophosphatase (non-canonical NTP hydrolase)
LADITSDNYAAAAVSTECPYEPVIERLRSDRRFTSAIVSLLCNSIDLGNDQDVLKKTLFYGKAPSESFRTFDEPHVENQQGASDTHQAIVGRIAADPRVIRLLHAVIGLQTEASELQGALAAYLFEGQPIDWTNISEESGDECWYLGIIADILQTPLTQILKQNIDKLRLRYPNKFTSFDALNRNLSTERTFLEESTVCS